MTNELLYSPDPSMQDCQNQYVLSEEELDNKASHYLKSLFTQPFVELLRKLIGLGCDPHAIVQKTKFYRELDEYKRHQASLKEQREAVQEVEMI